MFRRIASTPGKWAILGLVVALAVIGFSHWTEESQSTTVSGVVRSAAGQPVAGALVKVRSAELGLGFMVVTQPDGRYMTPDLLPGNYTVQGIGGDFQSALAGPVDVGTGQQAKMDVTLSTLRQALSPAKRITENDYEKLIPEGDEKNLLRTRCLSCHGFDRIGRKRGTREEWGKSVDRMLFFLEKNGVPVSDRERDVMVEYLAAQFGPDRPRPRPEQAYSSDPNAHLPRKLLTGLEAKFVTMEFDLQPGIMFRDIAVDSQGNVWFTEGGEGFQRGKREPDSGENADPPEGAVEGIGRFDAQSLTYTRIVPPADEFFPSLVAITVDSRDRVWFSDNGPNGTLLQYDPQSEEFGTYDILPTDPPLTRNLRSLRVHPDESIWATGITSHRILKLNLKTQEWAEYPVRMGSLPYGMAFDGDGMVWHVGHYGDEIGKLDPSTSRTTTYRVPTPRSGLRWMEADADGNLWAAAHESGKLVKVEYRTGNITEYTPPTEDSGPFSLDVDISRNLIWFGETNAGKVGRYDPQTASFVEFPLPSADQGGEFSDGKVIWVEVDPVRPNRVWWAGGTPAKIGYVEIIQ